MVEGARKTAGAPFEIGKDTISSLRAQCLETVFEEALVVHSGPLLVAVILAEERTERRKQYFNVGSPRKLGCSQSNTSSEFAQ